MSDFLKTYTGRMSGVLRWHQLDKIWKNLNTNEGWYLYEIGAAVPEDITNPETLIASIRDIDTFLHKEQDSSSDSDFCGVVYADNIASPSLLKIYHPKKMGASCGSSGATVLPKWTLSKMPPIDLLEWSITKDAKPSWYNFMLKKRA